MANHPQHNHPLHLTDPITVYGDFNGQWGCDNCGISYDRTHKPHHCSICSYDLCETCFPAKKHPRHFHDLYLSKMINIYPQYNGEWKCDACHSMKGPPLEPMAYHCYRDDFDLCKDCFKGRQLPIHRHPLVPADAVQVYNNSPGLWICDICKRHGTVIGTQFSLHCSECEFDCCNQCLKDVQIDQHPHPLKITDSYFAYPNFNGCWRCDICNLDYNPQTMGNETAKPFHCFTCEFDACPNCVNQILVADFPSRNLGRDEAGPPASAHNIPPCSTSNTAHEPPLELLEDEDVSLENLDDSQRCIVCLSKPKSATIVHGSTGHVCCCLACAYTLQRRGDKCPMCRADIDRVIKHYNS